MQVVWFVALWLGVALLALVILGFRWRDDDDGSVGSRRRLRR